MEIPEIWKQIRTFIPTAVIAGGAVRDAWFDTMPKDIDVFVSDRLPQVFPENWEYRATQNRIEEYDGNPGIMSIMNFDVDRAWDVQLIWIDRPFEEYINSFDLSTSFIWYNGALHLEPEFLETLSTGVVVARPDVTNPVKVNARAQRVLDKYENLRYEPLSVPTLEEIPF